MITIVNGTSEADSSLAESDATVFVAASTRSGSETEDRTVKQIVVRGWQCGRAGIAGTRLPNVGCG